MAARSVKPAMTSTCGFQPVRKALMKKRVNDATHNSSVARSNWGERIAATPLNVRTFAAGLGGNSASADCPKRSRILLTRANAFGGWRASRKFTDSGKAA
jgi:hypothetical protein